jgi:hypothetical protein
VTLTPLSREPADDGASSQLARRLFLRELGTATGENALLGAAERLCARVPDGLARWFGPYGALALVTRALSSVQTEYPALAEVAVSTSALNKSSMLVGLRESARVHGAAATAEGIIAVVEALADLIGRLIGDDLSVSLLERSVPGAVPQSANGTEPTSSDATPTVKGR